MKKIFLAVLLAVPLIIFAQSSITLNYIDMYGEGGTSDQVVASGETVTVYAKYTTESIGLIADNGIHNTGNSGGLGDISIYCYDDDEPTDGYIDVESAAISNFDLTVSGSDSLVTFDFTVPETLDNSTKSIQIMFGLYGVTTGYQNFYGIRYQSHMTDNGYNACSSSGSYFSYLEYTADTETEAPTLDLPTASSTIGQNFTVQYDQPEAAYSGSVKLTFTRTGGTADDDSPHVLTVASLTAGDNKTLSIDGDDLDGSTGVSGGTNLVHGAVYTVRIEYQDEVQNTAAYDENTGITYDNVTQTPNLDLPAASDTIGNSFTVQYDQPEAAYSGSVKLTFTRTAGTSYTGDTHILTVASTTVGNDKQLTINGANLDGSAGVSLLSGDNALRDGRIYTVKIEYQDAVQNTAASDQNAGVKYDTDTASPTLDLPAASTTISCNFTVQYDQPEAAYSGSVKLTFTRTAGASYTGDTHILTVTSLTAGDDKTLSINGEDLASSTGISSVSGGSALQDGRIYTVKIEYQDEAQNTAASDENTGVTYDKETEAPNLDLPAANQTISQDFTVQYDQPETAYSGSVKLTFTRTAGTADPNSPHVLTVASTTAGSNKTLSIDGSDLGGSDGVSLDSGGNSLVNSSIYTIKIEYQDTAQNTAASDQNAGITYDTGNLLLVSGSDYNIGQAFNPGTSNNAFFILEMQTKYSGENATIDAIEFDLTGDFISADIDAIKIWRSSDNSFDADTDTYLLQDTTAPFDPFTADFSPDQTVGTTKIYYFLTVDVSSSADTDHSLGAQILNASKITASMNVSGIFPISGGDHPLPVVLSAFLVKQQGREPLISWSTESETNNALWNIYRSQSPDMQESFQLNEPYSIPGQGTTSMHTDYSYLDYHPVEATRIYWYWLESIAYNGATEIYGPITLTVPYNAGSEIPEAPTIYGLHQNFPNPFNPSTQISFILPYDSKVDLEIYNIKGEKIKVLYDGFVEADQHFSIMWNGLNSSNKDMPTGLYLYRLTTSQETFYRKMNLIK